MMRETQLYLDAFNLAMEITARLRRLERQGKLYHGHRLLELGNKAWLRYHRRRQVLVMQGSLPPLPAHDKFFL